MAEKSGGRYTEKRKTFYERGQRVAKDGSPETSPVRRRQPKPNGQIYAGQRETDVSQRYHEGRSTDRTDDRYRNSSGGNAQTPGGSPPQGSPLTGTPDFHPADRQTEERVTRYPTARTTAQKGGRSQNSSAGRYRPVRPDQRGYDSGRHRLKEAASALNEADETGRMEGTVIRSAVGTASAVRHHAAFVRYRHGLSRSTRSLRRAVRDPERTPKKNAASYRAPEKIYRGTEAEAPEDVDLEGETVLKLEHGAVNLAGGAGNGLYSRKLKTYRKARDAYLDAESGRTGYARVLRERNTESSNGQLSSVQAPGNGAVRKQTEEKTARSSSSQTAEKKNRKKKRAEKRSEKQLRKKRQAEARRRTMEAVKRIFFGKGRGNGCLIGVVFAAIIVTGTLAGIGSLFVGGGGGNIDPGAFDSLIRFYAGDEDLTGAEADYTALENALRKKISEWEETMPGYDGYRYELNEIGHDPYALASYLTVRYGSFSREEVKDELVALYRLQYSLAFAEVEEDGEFILYLMLENKTLPEVIRTRLTGEDYELYRYLVETKGGKEELFPETFPETTAGETEERESGTD